METDSCISSLEVAQGRLVGPESSGESDSREPSPVVCIGGAGGEEGCPVTGEAVTGKQRKEAAKARKREDKAIEAVLKALGSLESPEEKLAALCKRYADLLEDNRVLTQKVNAGQKSLATLLKEKDQLQSEHSKAVLAKSKLESLCRELQRHNKLIKEESVARAKEEEEKRKEVTSKFQTTITDIQTQMNEHYANNTKLREENGELAGKLKSLIEQYELREEHVEKVFKHKELEGQLATAKLEQANLELREAKEIAKAEKELLLREAAEAHKRAQLLEENEFQLRAQLSLYTEKYQEFQDTISKSNDVFQSFKQEMEKMTKKMKKLEKETVMWKTRWEKSNQNILEMAEQKQRSDAACARSEAEAGQLRNKLGKLESLCRALQEERRRGATANGGIAPEGADSLPGGSGAPVPMKTPPNTPDERSSPPPAHPQNGDVTQRNSADVTQGNPADVTQGNPEDVTHGNPGDVTQGNPADVTQGSPADVTERETPSTSGSATNTDEKSDTRESTEAGEGTQQAGENCDQSDK